MEEILETTLLEYGKSAFLIDLVVHDRGKKYIRIIQTISDEEAVHSRVIKINPSLLSDMIHVLNAYSKLADSGRPVSSRKARLTVRSPYLSELQKDAIKQRYLKGIPIYDLTLQFDCKQELIEQILRNQGIAIIDNKCPEKRVFRKWRRGKR